MDDEAEYGLLMSFWIDTDGYTKRDREMFAAGVEFKTIYQAIKAGKGWCRPIRMENSSRVRMLCHNFEVPYELHPHRNYEGCETWAALWIAPANSENET